MVEEEKKAGGGGGEIRGVFLRLVSADSGCIIQPPHSRLTPLNPDNVA